MSQENSQNKAAIDHETAWLKHKAKLKSEEQTKEEKPTPVKEDPHIK